MKGFDKSDVGSHELMQAGLPALMTPAEYAGLSAVQKALVAQIEQHAGWRPVIVNYGRPQVVARHGGGQDVAVEVVPDWEQQLEAISVAHAQGKRKLQCAQCQTLFYDGGRFVSTPSGEQHDFCSDACVAAFYTAKAQKAS